MTGAALAAIGKVVGGLVTVASAATGAVSSVQAHDAAKKQERAQKEALRKQEEEALKKGSEATAVNAEDSDMEEARKRLLRKGFLGSLKTGETGLGTPAPTAGVGLKSSLG